MPQFTTENVCYVKHGERQIMARVFKPEGAGPFPCFIDLHGGAWNNGDLADRTGLGEYLAQRGTVMVTLNFRHAADGYPTSCADINYGIRWTKAHAKELKVNPGQIVIGGASSGGHLAMLVAMRPNDPRYAAIPGPAGVDASVQGVVMQWPVINPLLLLERGEKVVMPPALWHQGRPDEVHDYHDPDGGFAGNEPERFVSNYRKAGGDIEIAYFDNEKRNTDTTHAAVVDFMKKHVK